MDLRSPTENQNAGFQIQKGSYSNYRNRKEVLVTQSQDQMSTKSDLKKKKPSCHSGIDDEIPVSRNALTVQQNISVSNQFVIKEIDEFDLYQQEIANPDDLDQRVLRYFKKTIDIFEYVNKIQLY